MRERHKIEFHPLTGKVSPLGYEIVDTDVEHEHVKQVMANWYLNMEHRAWIIMDMDMREDEMHDLDQDDVDRTMSGTFIIRNARGEIVDRVSSAVVKVSNEIENADPLWIEKRDPEYDVKLKEKQRDWDQADYRSRRRFIRRLERPDYDPDIPF